MCYATSLEPLPYAVFHVDVNSAYLAWEAIDRLQHGDPVDLRQLTSVVGDVAKKGILIQ